MREREREPHEQGTCLNQIKLQSDRNRWIDTKPEETKDTRTQEKLTSSVSTGMRDEQIMTLNHLLACLLVFWNGRLLYSCQNILDCCQGITIQLLGSCFIVFPNLCDLLVRRYGSYATRQGINSTLILTVIIVNWPKFVLDEGIKFSAGSIQLFPSKYSVSL